MRICLATESPAPSGMGVHMLALAEALPDHDCVILAPSHTDLFCNARGRFAVKDLPSDADALALYLRQGGFDVVHLHAGIGWEGHTITRAAAAAGVPLIRTEHLPQLLTDADEQSDYAAAHQSVAATIAVSDAVAQSYAASGLTSQPLAVIRNGIVPPPCAAPGAARFERTASRPMLLNVGRLAAQKNQPLLIDAVMQLAAEGRGVDLVLVGDGPDRARIIAHIQRTRAEGHVRLMGQRADVAALMQQADLYVHASDFEGLPLVLLEAMAARLPIVARSAPGVDEALDQNTAALVAGDDAASLARAIRAALDDPARCRARATRARDRQQRQFAAERMAAETAQLYSLHARKGPSVDQLRIGFIGAGGIACRHRDVLQTMEDVRIAAACDTDTERAHDFAAQVGAKVYADWQTMLSSGEVDAVFICVPPFAHGPIEDAVIAASLPFFVEKPVALSLGEAERIAAAADAHGLVTAVGYHWRWLDTLDDVRHAMGERRPRLVSGYWLDSTPPVAWWWRQEQSGGQMLEQATHIVDLARYLCGDVVSAYGLAEHSARASHPELDVATASIATLAFADGAIGNFAATCLLGWNHRVGLHLFGDGFAIELTDHDVMIDVGAGRPVTGNRSDPVWHQDRAFVDAARGGENRIRCTYRDAVETLRVMDAIGQSVASGQAVKISAPARALEQAA